MGLPPLNDVNRPAAAPLEIEMDLVDQIELQDEQHADGAVPADPA